MQFLSPAKINLSLKILGKRADGYHELETEMQAIGLYDTLDIEPADRDAWTCSDSSLPMDERNLVVKALRLFREQTGNTGPLRIHLEKRIPHQAGLGGGSSNAATMLFALNTLFAAGLSTQDLIGLGAQLGSDVPFFFSLGSAICRGRGERVQELQPHPLEPITIVKPPYGLSTPKVFAEVTAAQRDPGCANDLEAPALRVEPRLQALKEHLCSAGFERVTLSGSGTAFYCFGQGQIDTLPEDTFCETVGISTRQSEGWYQ